MNKNAESTKKKLSKALWTMILIRGAIMATVGIVLLAFPATTLKVLLFIMGAWWLADGISIIVKSIRGRDQAKVWGWGVLTGVIGIIAGVVVLAHPLLSSMITTSFVVWFLGISALVYGVNGIITGIRLRKQVEGEWSMILGGAFSVFFGIILMISPYVSALVIIKTMGLVALIGGITIILLAFQLKKRLKQEST